MPPTTKHRQPVIVYLPTEVKRRLEEAALGEGRTLSQMGCRLIEAALTPRVEPRWLRGLRDPAGAAGLQDAQPTTNPQRSRRRSS